mgnify:CR=1 FL=1
MVSFSTNRHNRRRMEALLHGGGLFRAILLTDDGSPSPSVDVNTMAEVTEVDPGNGYVSGGNAVVGNSTNFPVTQDQALNRAYYVIADQEFTPAAAGTLPATGSGASYMALCGPEQGSPSDIASLDVLDVFGLGGARYATYPNSISVRDAESRINAT